MTPENYSELIKVIEHGISGFIFITIVYITVHFVIELRESKNK